jgi:hypothetical protein
MQFGDGLTLHIGNSGCNPGDFGENPEDCIQFLFVDQVQ